MVPSFKLLHGNQVYGNLDLGSIIGAQSREAGTWRPPSAPEAASGPRRPAWGARCLRLSNGGALESYREVDYDKTDVVYDMV